MKKCIAWVFLALMLVVSQALAEDILYTGTVSKDMTIRAKKSTSAQKLGSVAAGDPFKLADYYWGVAYLYALKRLFTAGYDMISAADLDRTLLKGGR